MARLLLEDVTLRREQEIRVQVRFKGGATQELRLPVPKSAWALRKTKPEIVHEIDHLLDERTESLIASTSEVGTPVPAIPLPAEWFTGCGTLIG